MRQHEDRDVEFACERLEAAADVRDLLLAILGAAGVPRSRHELQVVDDDQAEFVLGHEAARARPELHHGEVGIVVDEDASLGHLSGRVGESLEVTIRELPVPHAAHVDARLGAEHPRDELHARHLQ